MSKLSTENVKTQEAGGANKMLSPGNHVAFIRSVTLEQIGEMAKKKNAYHIVLHLEGEPQVAGFEGFFIDPKDESKGRYKGQIARVKTSNWPYSDAETKRGLKINRDMEILKMIKTICVQLGKESWFDAQNNKHDTIEQFVEAFNTDAPFADIKLNFCIAGREYPKEDSTYMGIDLFLPKYKNGIAIEALGVEKSKLLTFNPDEHFEKHEAASVQEFAGDTTASTDDSFTL